MLMLAWANVFLSRLRSRSRRSRLSRTRGFRSAWLVAGGLALAGLASAAPEARASEDAGSVWYRWVTEDGVVSVTDDARRIPERYREQAAPEKPAGLEDYDHYTPTDSEAVAARRERLRERLSHLRRANAPALAGTQAAAAPSGAEGEGSAVVLNAASDRRSTVELDLAETDSEPVVVEVRRVLDTATHSTRHVTVVRRGDRILSVVDPRKRVSPPSAGTLEDLLEGRD